MELLPVPTPSSAATYNTDPSLALGPWRLERDYRLVRAYRTRDGRTGADGVQLVDLLGGREIGGVLCPGMIFAVNEETDAGIAVVRLSKTANRVVEVPLSEATPAWLVKNGRALRRAKGAVLEEDGLYHLATSLEVAAKSGYLHTRAGVLTQGRLMWALAGGSDRQVSVLAKRSVRSWYRLGIGREVERVLHDGSTRIDLRKTRSARLEEADALVVEGASFAIHMTDTVTADGRHVRRPRRLVVSDRSDPAFVAAQIWGVFGLPDEALELCKLLADAAGAPPPADRFLDFEGRWWGERRDRAELGPRLGGGEGFKLSDVARGNVEALEGLDVAEFDVDADFDAETP